MTVDTAFRRLREANPVPEPALLLEDGLDLRALLVLTQQRSSEMQTQEPIKAAPKSRPPRRNLMLGLAAAIAAVIVGLVVFLPEDDPIGDQQPVPTTAPTPVTEPEVPTTLTAEEATLAKNTATLEAMITTRNSGDFEAWEAYLSETAAIWGHDPGSRDWVEWQRSVMAANEQWTVIDECRSTNPSTRFVCHMTLINDFMEPAGLFYDTPAVIIEFNSAGEITTIVANNWNIADDPEPGYWIAFDTWFAETYPEVYDTLGPNAEGEPGLPNAEAMPTALQYVDEFIAQSDIYPLDG